MRSETKKPELIDHLLAKYREDPGRFRAYLPEVAYTLDSLAPVQRLRRDPFGLTERERQYHQQQLRDLLEVLAKGTIPAQDAVRGLEHCAILIEDGSVPLEIEHKTVAALVKAAMGHAPGSVKRNTTFPLQDSQKGKAVSHVSVLRGVVLDLTGDMRLVSITVTPRKVQEGRRLMRFVGIAQDTASDVAEHHDEYLAEAYSHGPS